MENQAQQDQGQQPQGQPPPGQPPPGQPPQGQPPPQNRSRPILLWCGLILALLCVLGAGGSVLAWNQLYQPPGGTPLVQVKGAPAATAAGTAGTSGTADAAGTSGTPGAADTSGTSGTPGAADTSGTSGTPGAADTSGAASASGTTTPSAAQSASGVCAGSGQQIILLLGYDTRVEFPYGSDGLRLLRADYANQTMELLAMPRGIWVGAPAEVQPALQAASLGELYQYGLDHDGPDVKEARTFAARLVAQALYDNFGLAPDNFVVAEMQAFEQVVNSMGGIDIILPVTTTLNGQVYPAGAQHWDGATTLQYVRELPVEDNDWARFDRQDLVLHAMKDSPDTASMLTQLPALLTQLETGVTTDLSLSGVADVACLAGKMTEGQVQPESLPEDLVTQGPGVYLIPDYQAITDYLALWASGQ